MKKIGGPGVPYGADALLTGNPTLALVHTVRCMREAFEAGLVTAIEGLKGQPKLGLANTYTVVKVEVESEGWGININTGKRVFPE